MKKKQQKIELIQREGCGEFNKWEQKKSVNELSN